MRIDEYCKDCRKLKESGCIYSDPIAKTGANRGFSIGCAFSGYSSSLVLVAKGDKERIGQKKSKKKSKQKNDRSYKRKHEKWG